MLMDLVRGFSNRNAQVSSARLPPGQTLVSRWLVMTYGSTPGIDLATWRLEITGLVEEETSLS